MVDGFWGCLAGVALRGYEIHLGQTPSAGLPLLQLEERDDGSVLGDVAGTYVHGLFEGEAPRTALVQALVARRGSSWHCHRRPQPRTRTTVWRTRWRVRST
jgi:adenosylcobyric acid synthase